mmetsp:Transcript_39506/g.58133  ORF Transcript_39506/g.58133 Transcript_39506/m.58133 type:complete len:94 (-) Transcript_39506:30-311(-)
MLASLFTTKLILEPAYEAYVRAAGIDGSSDFHINEMYGCPTPPCPGGWDFPSSKGAPSNVFAFGQMSLGTPTIAHPDGYNPDPPVWNGVYASV